MDTFVENQAVVHPEKPVETVAGNTEPAPEIEVIEEPPLPKASDEMKLGYQYAFGRIRR